MQYIFIFTSALKILSIVLPITLISSTSRNLELEPTPPMFVSLLFILVIPISFSVLLNYIAFKVQQHYIQR